MNIVFLDEYSLGGIDLSRIKQLGNYTGYEKTTPGEIAERCIDADIVITNKVPLRAEAIKVLPQLKLICIAATGMNNVDLEAAAERGIEVRNAVGYSTHAVTETTIGAAIALLRQSIYYDRYVKSGEYAASDAPFHFGRPLHQLYGKRWGIIGLGAIGHKVAGLKKAYAHEMDTFAPHNALSETFKLIQRANKYIDENAPWALAKDMEASGARLAHVLYNLLEATRICGILLTPFMPESMEKLFAQIGVGAEARTWESADLWGELPETAAVVKGENLFPRLDLDKALAELEAAEAAAKKAEQPDVEVEPQLTETVDFDTFCKSDFRVVKVKACEAVKKSDKLLRFTLDDGTGTDRQILSGVHKFYEPEELVGKTLAAIVNLPPRKMMGLESNGMLLSAVHTEKGEEKLNLIMLDDQIPAGSKLC